MKKNNFIKSSIFTGLILSISCANAFEITKDINTILFSSMENDQYQLTIITPDLQRHQFHVKSNDFEISPSLFGLDNLSDGFYKYEFSPKFDTAELGKDVRNLNDPQMTQEFKSIHSKNTESISGAFSVFENKILDGDEISDNYYEGGSGGGTTRDQVILDDLIVDGSACIGFDCVNGESFGFDTLRLKENNLRIKFDDTSTGSSFPNNDWQITINDSANGGANKFSIDDISNSRTPFTVEARAPSHSLYVDDGGRLGLGTSTPSTDIHAISGDSPTLRLQQDGSSGFAPQTWDVAGNETNFFVRDVTNGSQLPFRIRPEAPTNSIFIDTDGDVGFGTASPSADFEVASSESFVFYRLTASGASPNTSADITYTDGGAEGSLRFNIDDGDNQEMSIDHDGNMVIAGTLTTATTTYPDYVFEDGYNLLPLDDVQLFIDKNGHLPNIPPANEMIENGVNLTQMHIKVMEKVEELTLYSLQQHEEIKKLTLSGLQQHEEIKKLKEQITQLNN